MADKLRVYAYFDGSNFYHYCLQSYGIKNINFFDFTNQVINLNTEKLIKIKYFNCPVSQQDYPEIYPKQQRFFDDLRKTPLVELLLGNLVKRPLGKININCPSCGYQKSEILTCPTCKRRIDVKQCFKFSEKGVDVKLAIHMLLDALENKYDTALLFSSDSDYSPAINYIIKSLKKDVIYCYFPYHKTNELMQVCTDKRLITKDMVLNSQKQ